MSNIQKLRDKSDTLKEMARAGLLTSVEIEFLQDLGVEVEK